MTFYMYHPMNWYEARRQMMRRMMAEHGFERTMWFPVEIKAAETEYVVRALLPGQKAEDVKIEFENNVLKIEGELKFERSENDEYVIDEIPQGKFSRSFELSDAVESDNIQASMSNGVLTVHIPKAPETKPRTIKINVEE